jgi:hypothetical protein
MPLLLHYMAPGRQCRARILDSGSAPSAHRRNWCRRKRSANGPRMATGHTGAVLCDRRTRASKCWLVWRTRLFRATKAARDCYSHGNRCAGRRCRVWRVTVDVFTMVLIGEVAGLAVGMASARYITALLFQVRATDLAMVALPSLSIFNTALLAALPAVIRAVRCDPVSILRAE